LKIKTHTAPKHAFLCTLISHKLEGARDIIVQKVIDSLQTYKASVTATGAGTMVQLAISENMMSLVLALGLLKICQL